MKTRTLKPWWRFIATGNDPSFIKKRQRKYARRRSGGLFDRVEQDHGCGHKHIKYIRVECGKGILHKGRKP